MKYLLAILPLFLIGCTSTPKYEMYAECYDADETRNMNQLEWKGLKFIVVNGSCDVIDMKEVKK